MSPTIGKCIILLGCQAVMLCSCQSGLCQLSYITIIIRLYNNWTIRAILPSVIFSIGTQKKCFKLCVNMPKHRLRICKILLYFLTMVRCKIMFQPLSPFSSRAKVMVQQDKTPAQYHSGPSYIAVKPNQYVFCKYWDSKAINIRATSAIVSVFDSFVEGCKQVNKMRSNFKLNKATCVQAVNF